MVVYTLIYTAKTAKTAKNSIAFDAPTHYPACKEIRRMAWVRAFNQLFPGTKAGHNE